MLAIINHLLARTPHQGRPGDPPPSRQVSGSAPGEIEGRGQDSQQIPPIPRGMGRSGGRWSSQSSLPPVGTQGLTACSPFLLTLPYFTADCSCRNWNEDELQATGKVPGHPGRAAARGAAILPERYGGTGRAGTSGFTSCSAAQ